MKPLPTRCVAVLMGLVPLFFAPASSADSPKFTTTFRFEAKFSDGVQTYNENQGIGVNVWLPGDMKWACVRPSPSVIDGRRRGSFACTNDDWKTSVLTMVGCKIDEVDAPRTAAMRLFGPAPPGTATTDGGLPPVGKFVDLTVSCETARVP